MGVKGGERAAGQKVAGRKGLQGHALDRCFAVPGLAQMVAQLTHQHRWRQWLVVVGAPSLPADVQAFTR